MRLTNFDHVHELLKDDDSYNSLLTEMNCRISKKLIHCGNLQNYWKPKRDVASSCDALLAGGLISNIISRHITTSAVQNAVKTGIEDLSSSYADLDFLERPDVAAAVSAIGKAYNETLSGDPARRAYRYRQLSKLGSKTALPIYFTDNPANPLIASPIPVAYECLCGGFLDSVKKVANKVTGAIKKVADIPVLGNVIKAIPGVGTVLNAVDIAHTLTSSPNTNEQSQSVSTATQPISSSSSGSAAATSPEATITSATEAAASAVKQMKNQEFKSEGTSAESVIEDTIPVDMSQAVEMRAKKANVASLVKNAAQLTKALGAVGAGDPITTSDAQKYVVAILSVPAESAQSLGIKMSSRTGIWKDAQLNARVIDGITTTDATASLQIALSLAATYVPDMSAFEIADPVSIGFPMMLPVIGAIYLSAAVPEMVASANDIELVDLTSQLSSIMPTSLLIPILAQIESGSAPNATVLANWELIAGVLTQRVAAGSTDEREKQALEALRALGSSALVSASAADINAIRACLPPVLTTLGTLINRSSLMTNCASDNPLSWLSTSEGMETADAYVSASTREREELISSIPHEYRSQIRQLAAAYDEEGETGVSKFLKSIGSYVSSTVKSIL